MKSLTKIVLALSFYFCIVHFAKAQDTIKINATLTAEQSINDGIAIFKLINPTKDSFASANWQPLDWASLKNIENQSTIVFSCVLESEEEAQSVEFLIKSQNPHATTLFYEQDGEDWLLKSKSGEMIDCLEAAQYPENKLYGRVYLSPKEVRNILIISTFYTNFDKNGFSILSKASETEAREKLNKLNWRAILYSHFIMSVLLFIALISLGFFAFNRDRINLFYAGFVFCFFVYFGLQFEQYFQNYLFFTRYFSKFFIRFSDTVLVLASIFYFLFSIYFIQIKEKLPCLHFQITHRIVPFLAYIVLPFNILMSPLVEKGLFGANFKTFQMAALLLLSIYITLRILWVNQRLGNLIAIGTLLFLLSFGLDFIFQKNNTLFLKVVNENLSFTPPFFAMTGIFLQTLFLAFAIGFRSKMNILDKTEREKEILEQKNELQRLDFERKEAQGINEMAEIKDRFYANITHEFRTPLTVIKGFTEEIQGHQMQKNFILNNCSQLLEMINQLLDLSAIEANAHNKSPQNIEINQFLQYITDSFQSLAAKKNIHLNFYSPQKSIFANVAPEYLQRIVVNLLSNAIKFTNEYGKVLLMADIVENQLLIKIIDNGNGISNEQLDRIFDRFYQADNSNTRSHQGTGIGLALVKELVQILQGVIKVESTLAKGTTFSLYLPILKEEIEENQEIEQEVENMELIPADYFIEEKPQNIATDSFEKNDKKEIILIVEDNIDVAKYLSDILEKKYGTDYDIQHAKNGRLGLDIANLDVPAIIISDVMMPEIDGFTLCQTLKNGNLTAHIPIILLTAKSTTQDKIQGWNAEADGYLTKPFEKDELLAKIDSLLANRKKVQRYYQSLFFPKDRDIEEITNDIATKTETKEMVVNIVKDPFIVEFDALILKNLDNDAFPITRVCRVLAVSRTQLHRKITVLTGLSATHYIKNYKLKIAYELLTTTTKKITEIAYDIGYKNPAHFSEDFKNLYGITPSETRK